MIWMISRVPKISVFAKIEPNPASAFGLNGYDITERSLKFFKRVPVTAINGFDECGGAIHEVSQALMASQGKSGSLLAAIRQIQIVHDNVWTKGPSLELSFTD